jgi:hypothetical protein
LSKKNQEQRLTAQIEAMKNEIDHRDVKLKEKEAAHFETK